jgi:hypothetical protein
MLPIFTAFLHTTLVAVIGTAGGGKGAHAPEPEVLQPLSLSESLGRPELSADPARTRVTRDDFPAPERLPLYPSLARKAELKIGGGLYGNFDTSIGVSSDVLVGAKIALEDGLGVNDSVDLLRMDGVYRFTPRHVVRASFYDLRRSGSNTVAEDIPIGEVILPAGQIETGFDTKIFKLAYQYNFITDHRTKLGASFGFHSMGVGASFRTSTGLVEESFDVIAPLPVIGLAGEYALTKTLHLLATFEVFQIEMFGVRGRLVDSVIAIEHDLFDHVGWGVGFNNFELNATLEGDGPLTADMSYGYQGVLLYLRFYV